MCERQCEFVNVWQSRERGGRGREKRERREMSEGGGECLYVREGRGLGLY